MCRMTKRQAKQELSRINKWLAQSKGAWGYMDTELPKALRMMFNQRHYEACIEANVDPDSIIHYGMIKDGKGRKWTSACESRR